MTRKLLAVLFSLTAFTTATATAQETPRLGETVEVSIVNVDVVVTDGKGNRVRGLTRDDFEIFENGKPQPVSNFAEYASDGPDARVTVAGEATTSAPAPHEKRTFQNLAMQMAYYEMTQRVGAINASINSIAGIDGKKILLLATRRLGEVAGAEFAYHSGLSLMPAHLRNQYGTEKLRQSIIDNANAAGVTIYPVYPATVEGDGSAADYLTLGNETLSMADIAKQTGGLSANGPKNVVDLLPRIASDVSNYYSLAYRVRSDHNDRARSITVKTRNPEYAVRTRTQFVEKSDDTRMRDRLKAALFRASEKSDIAIAVQAGKAKKGRRTSTVPVEVKIPIRQLTLLPQGAKSSGKFSVYIGVATELNDLSDVTQKTQPFEVTAAQLKQALASYFTYEMDVQVNARSKYLAVGVFDEVGRTYGLQRIELEPGK
jgi:Ca-activated chloride channel family protein